MAVDQRDSEKIVAAGGADRRMATVGLAALLLAVVFALRIRSDSDDAMALLYAVPVAMVGFELGLGAGLLTALAALGLMGVSVAIGNSAVDPVGLGARVAAIAGAALLSGRFGERRHGQDELRFELERTRLRVADRLRDARSLLDHQEAERGAIAHQLHEQATQTLAAAMMTLSLLEHDADQARLDRTQVEAIRGHMRECLEELRQLADSLRPAALVELGLPAALEHVCVAQSERTGHPIALRTDGLAGDRLPAGIEAAAYRTVGEALSALDGDSEVRVTVDGDGRRLRIAIAAGAGDPGLPAKLAPTRARLKILDGSLRIDALSQPDDDVEIDAEIPLPEAMSDG